MAAEDFEDEQPQLTHQQRAHRLAESVLANPLNDDQATALAAVYAQLATVDALNEAFRGLREPLEAIAEALSKLNAPAQRSTGPKPAQRRTAPLKPTGARETK